MACSPASRRSPPIGTAERASNSGSDDTANYLPDADVYELILKFGTALPPSDTANIPIADQLSHALHRSRSDIPR